MHESGWGKGEKEHKILRQQKSAAFKEGLVQPRNTKGKYMVKSSAVHTRAFCSR